MSSEVDPHDRDPDVVGPGSERAGVDETAAVAVGGQDVHAGAGAADSLGEDPAYVDDSGELPLLVPARERFAGLDPVPTTGEARVDAATARLEEIAGLPTVEHVEVYEDVHRRLQGALADADPH